MKLVFGLGNPGREYRNTRHNVGFSVIDSYVGHVYFREKYSSLYYITNINGEKVVFVKPQTYMNDSGRAVMHFVNYYKLSPSDILVIHDDMDFDIGNFKLKKTGSSAGHNGIKSIIDNLGTEDFKRIRIGISKAPGDTVDYVLGNFEEGEIAEMSDVIEKLKLVLDDYFKMDFDSLMNKYN